MKKRGLLCLLTAGILALSACGKTEEAEGVAPQTPVVDEVVMTIDGEEIMKSEYMVYLYTSTQGILSVLGEEEWDSKTEGKTGDEWAAERTLNTLQTVVAAKKYATENDITLTEEEKATAKTTAENFMGSVSAEDIGKMGVNEEILIPLMEESFLFSKVMQTISEEAEVSDAEKNTFFDDNKALLMDNYTEVALNTILIKDLKSANAAVQEFKGGADFDDLFAKYEVDEGAKAKEDGGKTKMSKGQFKSAFKMDAVPAVGEIAGPIEEQGAYFVILVEGETVPTEAEVRAFSDSGFTMEKQKEYANGRMEEMIATQEITYVDEVFNALENFRG